MRKIKGDNVFILQQKVQQFLERKDLSNRFVYNKKLEQFLVRLIYKLVEEG